MGRIAVTLVLVALLFGRGVPQDQAALRSDLTDLIAARNYPAAITALLETERSDPKAFVAGDRDYLLARLAESGGDLAMAMANYQRVAVRDSRLRGYALMHLSGIARSMGNLVLERLYLQQLLLIAPDGTLSSSAMNRLARNSFDRQNYAEAIRLLSAPGGGASAAGPASRRETVELLAEAYLRSGEVPRAKDIFKGLLSAAADAGQPDDVARSAAKALDLIDGGTDEKAPAITEAEHLQRANIYQFNRDFEAAQKHFEAIAADSPAGANTPDALFQIGRGQAQHSDFVEAIKWFERVQEQFPQSPSAKDALLQGASAYSRVGKHKEAITRYQRFIEKYPSDEKVDRAYLNIVDILRDQGEESEALKWTAKTQQAFKGKLPEAVALFDDARIYIDRDDWQSALADLERLTTISDLGGATVPGGTSREEVLFLSAFCLEQSKRYAEAIDRYLSIEDGRSEYYGWRSTERLRQMSGDETSRSFISQKLGSLSNGLKAKDAESRRTNAQSILRLTDSPDVREKAMATLKAALKTLPKYQGVPALQLLPAEKNNLAAGTVGERLLSLGLYDEASCEMGAAPIGGHDDRSFTTADRFRRGDRADRGIAFIEPLWRTVPADYPISLIPRDQLEMLYPAPYADHLLRDARDKGVDPRLLLAIMRQESRFAPDAKSAAAARGLMQFISTTSDHVAGELRRDDLRQDELYYPPTAILFGAQYVADLAHQFPDQPDAIVAAYNGGDDNMKRWLVRSRSGLPDRYVPEIVYAQSKDYVYKVMANYRMYQLLYDENLKLK